MELIVHFLMVLICLVACLKQKHAPIWFSWVYAFLLAIFTLIMTEWTSSQPQSVLSSYVEQNDLRSDMAILLTLECMLFILFSFLPLIDSGKMSRTKSKWHRGLVKALTYYPSLLVVPVLLYTQSQLFIAFPGRDFMHLSVALAIAVLLFFGFAPILFRKLLPDRELSLELLFLSSLFLFAFGLITTVDDRMIYIAPEYKFQAQGFTISLVVFLISFLIGFTFPIVKRIFTKKK